MSAAAVAERSSPRTRKKTTKSVGKNKVNVSTTMWETDAEVLKKAAARHNQSRNEFVRRILADAIEKFRNQSEEVQRETVQPFVTAQEKALAEIEQLSARLSELAAEVAHLSARPPSKS